MKQIPRDIAMKAAVGRIIDGEAWKAMEDGRASLEGSLWHLRQGWALEKAEQIIDAVKADLGTDKTLEHWRQEVGKLHSKVDRLKDALKPFVDDIENWTDEHGWTDEAPNRDRICDWFGPSDFRKAREAAE